jgi:seryl-tRNA synthetase
MAAKRTSVTKNEVLAAIPGSKGLIVNLENRLNCTRTAIKNAMSSCPEIKKEMVDEEEREKDTVLNNLIEDAKAGDKAARDLYLKAQARDRGFGDKLEVSGANGQPLVFLHAVATDLTANAGNGNASKEKRVSGWKNRAVEYHERQIAEVGNKSVDELLEANGADRK